MIKKTKQALAFLHKQAEDLALDHAEYAVYCVIGAFFLGMLIG